METEEAGLTISQMSAASGLTGHTLRYYERAGLIRPVARSAANQRRYAPADVEWVRFLLRLRETGMPVAQMREYARLRECGPETVEGRLRLLEEHQATLREKIAQLRGHETALAAKIELYRGDLAARALPPVAGEFSEPMEER